MSDIKGPRGLNNDLQISVKSDHPSKIQLWEPGKAVYQQPAVA